MRIGTCFKLWANLHMYYIIKVNVIITLHLLKCIATIYIVILLKQSIVYTVCSCMNLMLNISNNLYKLLLIIELISKLQWDKWKQTLTRNIYSMCVFCITKSLFRWFCKVWRSWFWLLCLYLFYFSSSHSWRTIWFSSQGSCWV